MSGLDGFLEALVAGLRQSIGHSKDFLRIPLRIPLGCADYWGFIGLPEG